MAYTAAQTQAAIAAARANGYFNLGKLMISQNGSTKCPYNGWVDPMLAEKLPELKEGEGWKLFTKPLEEGGFLVTITSVALIEGGESRYLTCKLGVLIQVDERRFELTLDSGIGGARRTAVGLWRQAEETGNWYVSLFQGPESNFSFSLDDEG